MPTIQSISAINASLAQLQRTYKTFDTNKDGALSLAEFEAAAQVNKGLNGDRGQSAAVVFKKLDANGNGTVSTAELSQGINLNSQVQAVLLQGQEIASNSPYSALLGDLTDAATGSLFRATNDYSTLTGSLFGGSASTSLTSILTGGSANATASAGLFGGISASTSALIQQLLARYNVTNPTAPTTSQTT